MKGLNLFLATCFVVPVFDGAMADTVKNTSRVPSIRNQTSTTISRNNNSTKQRTTNSARTTTNKGIVQRGNQTTTNVRNRAATTQTRENSVVARSAKSPSTFTRKQTQNATTPARTTVRSGLSRAATVLSRETVMQRDFGKCKSVFFDCMDEFCANKDAQLKRCACSSRTNEFQTTQKNLDAVEDKLLDFSQRLLKVNMDPADAAVINQESEGEKAYNETKDKTASRKTLDEIAKKLNANFDSAENNNMSALSWSLDADSAFDSVDSLGGVATTAKSGIALRNAALPICREMAAEVCANDDISLVENSYNMAIEQDCNTVKKAYETQTQTARNKILESSALLDMTRLNTYQDNNSDDILTCKSKMLDMLSNTNVCGENLTKCLDISGRYINPTTGEAFLSPELINISTLITRPTNSDSWAKTPKNSQFVSYLNTKKKYIEPATKNCQTIATNVWDMFLEDALAQIKIAQNAKLEEVRQSCTTLLSECLANANENLSEFDSRALSTFGVLTDKTANALCENVKKSCSAIMDYTPDDSVSLTGDDYKEYNWSTGTTQIAARESYNRIINTCREIGRDCIINSCKSISGNFGLCESIHGSVNRHSILNRSACWAEIENCIAQASDETIKDIHTILPSYEHIPADLYDNMYNASNVHDICRNDLGYCTPDSNTGNDQDSIDCYRCRIAEQIWGNCQHKPDNKEENAILIPTDPNSTTLLSWFAKNTHTNESSDSCAVSICNAGFIEYTIGTSTDCYLPNVVMQCPVPNDNILCDTTIQTPISTIGNCCPTKTTDKWGNCCMNTGATTNIIDHMGELDGTDSPTNAVSANSKLCTNNQNITSMTLVARYSNNGKTTRIFCTGTVSGTVDTNTPQVNCDGQYVIIECAGTGTNTKCVYSIPVTSTTNNYNINYFINKNANKDNETEYCNAYYNNTDICNINFDNNQAINTCTNDAVTGNNKHWLIDFNKQ